MNENCSFVLITASGGSAAWNLTNVGGTLFFSANDGSNGPALWKTDGTVAGTVLIIPNIVTANAPGMYAVLNNKLYLQVNESSTGSELWVTDGTTAGTHIVKNLSADVGGGVTGSGSSQNMTVYNNKLYFSGRDDTHGVEFFVTDGTDVGTQ